VDAYAKICGMEGVPHRTEIFPTVSDINWAMRTLPGGDWVAIHAGPSTWKGKQWPVDRFVAIAERLTAAGSRVVLVGSADRTAIPCALDLRGQTTVLQMAAVLRFCKLMVAIDSLPMHCAQAMGTPVVALFGVTSPEYIMTDGSPWHAVCGSTPCAGERHRVVGSTEVKCDGACMRSISVDMVMEAIKEFVAI
jgi:ADP-heptose:LPS heptosyltransferase